jgi:hypothetical protein
MLAMREIERLVFDFVEGISVAIEQAALEKARLHVATALGASIGRPGRPPKAVTLLGRKPRKAKANRKAAKAPTNKTTPRRRAKPAPKKRARIPPPETTAPTPTGAVAAAAPAGAT